MSTPITAATTAATTTATTRTRRGTTTITRTMTTPCKSNVNGCQWHFHAFSSQCRSVPSSWRGNEKRISFLFVFLTNKCAQLTATGNSDHARLYKPIPVVRCKLTHDPSRPWPPPAASVGAHLAYQTEANQSVSNISWENRVAWFMRVIAHTTGIASKVNPFIAFACIWLLYPSWS